MFLKQIIVICILSFALSISFLNVTNSQGTTGSECSVYWDNLSLSEKVKCAELGDVNTQYSLGRIYEFGIDTLKNDVEAIRWYKEAAEKGHDEAQLMLGGLYVIGQGVPEDFITAFMWLNISAAQGNEVAISNKNLMRDHMTTEQIASAQELSAQWFKDFETLNQVTQPTFDPNKPYEVVPLLGDIPASKYGGTYTPEYDEFDSVYEDSISQTKNVDCDLIKPTRQIDKLIYCGDEGNQYAQYILGYFYSAGEYVTKDMNEALRWYTLAAEQGDAHAQFKLGMMYSSGDGVSQNNSTAIKWYKLAAEQGLLIAQNNLGREYNRGIGVQKDIVTAYMWYNLAASKGNETSQSNKDRITRRMTQEEIVEAQRLSTIWENQNQNIETWINDPIPVWVSERLETGGCIDEFGGTKGDPRCNANSSTSNKQYDDPITDLSSRENVVEETMLDRTNKNYIWVILFIFFFLWAIISLNFKEKAESKSIHDDPLTPDNNEKTLTNMDAKQKYKNQSNLGLIALLGEKERIKWSLPKVLLIMAMWFVSTLLAAIISEILMGALVFQTLLVLVIFVPSLLAVLYNYKSSIRVKAALVGSLVGIIIWWVGVQAVQSSSSMLPVMLVTGAFVLSAMVTNYMCKKLDKSESENHQITPSL